MNNVRWNLFTDPVAIWDAWYEDFAAARHAIDIEQYIINDDPLGHRFLRLFIRKAHEGVKIRLLLDMVGSWNLYKSGWIPELRKAGINVVFFNPISPWRVHNFTAWFFRDHRKNMIIDGQLGYTGGLGFNETMVDWHDTVVRLEGPIIGEMMQAFEQMWNFSRTGRFGKFGKIGTPATQFHFYTNAPYFGRRYVYRRLLECVQNAKEYIYFSSPYFVPDLGFLRSLRLAAKRGVDVRILLPEYSDHILLDHAARSYFGLALRAGIKIYITKNRVMHAKIGVIDGDWATVGSTNLDNLSFTFNYEANVISSYAGFADALQTVFLSLQNQSVMVGYKAWERRPVYSKILELLTWPLHKLF